MTTSDTDVAEMKDKGEGEELVPFKATPQSVKNYYFNALGCIETMQKASSGRCKT